MAINLSKGNTDREPIKVTILEDIGTIGTKEYKKGDAMITECLKLRYLQWSKGEPRYDLRSWTINPDGTETPGKGIGFTGESLIKLGELITTLQTEEKTEEKPKAKRSTKKKSA